MCSISRSLFSLYFATFLECECIHKLYRHTQKTKIGFDIYYKINLLRINIACDKITVNRFLISVFTHPSALLALTHLTQGSVDQVF